MPKTAEQSRPTKGAKLPLPQPTKSATTLQSTAAKLKGTTQQPQTKAKKSKAPVVHEAFAELVNHPSHLLMFGDSATKPACAPSERTTHEEANEKNDLQGQQGALPSPPFSTDCWTDADEQWWQQEQARRGIRRHVDSLLLRSAVGIVTGPRMLKSDALQQWPSGGGPLWTMQQKWDRRAIERMRAAPPSVKLL